uniref:Uncharacterized protein n=1 Tax=viral metagenome TaxID=1070528 RepID=A0A6M3LCL1_9ZZZZ
MLKIKKRGFSTIPATTMKDGDIAIIVDGGCDNEYEGVIVQRYGDYLAVLGAPYGNSWCGIPSNFEVEILPPGTEFILE